MPPTNVHVDPRGDLTVHVGPSRGSQQAFQITVCSRTMCRASAVWAKMLGTKPAYGPWILHLPDDDGSSLLAILNAAHSKPTNLDKQNSVRSLFRIVQLVEKYQLHGAVKTTTDRWFESGLHQMVEATKITGDLISSTNFQYFLHIAWVLGRPKAFGKAACQLLRFLVTSKVGRLGYPTSVWVDNSHRTYGDFVKQYEAEIKDEKDGGVRRQYRDLESSHDFGPNGDLVNTLRSRRGKAITRTINSLNDQIDALMARDGRVACVFEDRLCDKAILAELWIRIQNVRGDAFPRDPSQVCESVQTLLMELSHVFRHSLSHSTSHDQCSPHRKWYPFLDLMTIFLDNTDEFLSATYRQQLSKNYKQTHA